MEMKTAIYFNTSYYLASHGKEPKGRGFWAFDAALINGCFILPYGEEIYWANGTYSEARAKARKYFAEKYANRQTLHVNVLP